MSKIITSVKSFFLIVTLAVSQICLAQVSDDLMVYRKDFKENISAGHTVSITSYEKNGSHYIYTGGYGAIDVYSLNEDGKLTPISSHEIKKETSKGPARGLVADSINGTDFLFAASKNENVVESFKILDNGSLQRFGIVKDTDETHLGRAITLQVVHMKQSSYLFIGGLEETPGLSCYKIHNNGKLTHVQSMKDDDNIHTDGIVDMDIHKINGKTFLYTGGFHDNGFSSFRVYENGTFKNINNIDDNTTDKFLTGAYSVIGVKLGNNHFVIAGHRHHKYYPDHIIKKKDFVYHGEGVSVFKVTKKGALVPHFILKDDETTKLKGQTGIEVISTNNKEAILAVGTRDDTSIQLCKLNEEGILSPLSYLGIGFSIYSGFRFHKIGDANLLIAGSNRFDLKKIVTYEVSPKINRDGKVLKHIVNLKYREDATEIQIKKAIEAFINLKKDIPEIADIEWGINDSTEGHSQGFTHTFTLTFNDEHARETYLFHKKHLNLVNKVKPIIADVLVMDYWTKPLVLE